MSNGAQETYRVIDPGFHERFGSIPAGYQMDVAKLGIPEAQSAVQHITYNISGTNNRINQGSTDNSINIAFASSELKEQIAALRTEVGKLSLTNEESKAANEVIDAIEEHASIDKPSKSVIKALFNGLPSAGNIASIGSFILSLLA